MGSVVGATPLPWPDTGASLESEQGKISQEGMEGPICIFIEIDKDYSLGKIGDQVNDICTTNLYGVISIILLLNFLFPILSGGKFSLISYNIFPFIFLYFS